MRFGGTKGKSLYEIAADVVPFPRLHFVIPSKSPYIELNSTEMASNVDEMVNSVYDTSSHLLSADMKEGFALCSTLTFQGALVQAEINQVHTLIEKSEKV